MFAVQYVSLKSWLESLRANGVLPELAKKRSTWLFYRDNAVSETWLRKEHNGFLLRKLVRGVMKLVAMDEKSCGEELVELVRDMKILEDQVM